jgi:hypothetical protein
VLANDSKPALERHAELRKLLETQLDEEGNPARRIALRTLMLWLLPELMGTESHPYRATDRFVKAPQSAGLSREMWARIGRLGRQPDAGSEQDILRVVIQSPNCGDMEELAGYLSRPDSAEATVRFVKALAPQSGAKLAFFAAERASGRQDLPKESAFGELSSWRRPWLRTVAGLLEGYPNERHKFGFGTLAKHLWKNDRDLLIDILDCWITQGPLSLREPDVRDTLLGLSDDLVRAIEQRLWFSEKELEQIVWLSTRMHIWMAAIEGRVNRYYQRVRGATIALESVDPAAATKLTGMWETQLQARMRSAAAGGDADSNLDPHPLAEDSGQGTAPAG